MSKAQTMSDQLTSDEVTIWQRHELGEDTHITIGINGGILIKQRQGDEEVCIYLSATQADAIKRHINNPTRRKMH